jgi:glycosyltransferase involved in cell wall biosynthesis
MDFSAMQYRILILDNEFEMGGKEKKLFEFISRTDRSRFAISVCCLKEGGYFKSRLEALGVPFHDRLLRHRYDALAFRGLEAVLRRERTQLIYTFGHPNTVIFSYLARMRGLAERFVVSYHATGDVHEGRQVPRYLLPLLRRADAILAVADTHRDFLANVEGLPREMIRVIHNGVDATVYHPGSPGERAEVRAELGLGGKDLVLMAVASLKPLKRLDLLLRAAAPLAKRHPATRVVLVGGGPDRDSLAALAAELGMEKQVVFAGVRDDVPRLLRAADALVLSSRTEAFPNAVLEAMASGLPVVTTDVGSVREMVEDGRSALVVPAEDEAKLRAAIEKLAGDADLRSAFGVRGRAIVDARFRIETMCAQREALFQELLSSPAATRTQAERMHR